MSKHKKRRGAAHNPIPPKRSQPARPLPEVSLEALALGMQLKGQTPEQLQQRLERSLLRSIELRQEPEFADFHFDDQQFTETLERQLKRYKVRLDALINQGDAEVARELYDQMRIDSIAELVTPAVRRDLQERSDRCLARLRRGSETDRIEALVYVRTLLAGTDQMLPLGICGLFTSIYEDSHQRVLAYLDAELDLRNQFIDGLPGYQEATAEELLALAQRPEVVAQVTQTMEAHPELRARLERDVDRLIKEIGQAIRQGDIPASFFTDEEILITYADVYNAMSGTLRGKKAPSGPAVARKMFKFMQSNLAAIITPERNRQFRQYLETIGREMASSGDRGRRKIGMQLAVVAATLDTWELGKHPFLYETYVAQTKQMQEHGLAEGSSPEREALFRRLIAERGARKE